MSAEAAPQVPEAITPDPEPRLIASAPAEQEAPPVEQPPAPGQEVAPGIRTPQMRPLPPRPEPEWLSPELQERADKVRHAGRRNNIRLQALAKLGVVVPDAKILEAYLNVLTDVLFNERTMTGQRRKLEYEERCAGEVEWLLNELEPRAQEVLADVQAQIQEQQEKQASLIRQAMIANGGSQPTPAQLREIAEKLGIPVPAGFPGA